MPDYLDIAGRVRTTASDGVAVEAQEIKDLQKNKNQQQINADVNNELDNRYTKQETYNRDQLNELITTPDVNRVYVIATNLTTAVTDLLPETGSSDTLYNVGNWNGTQYDTTVYSIYGWDGTTYVCLAVRSSIGEVYDISANHLDGQGNPTPYADLTAALGTNGANIPADIRRGGMRIQFIQGTVQSVDNKYFQYRLMTTTWSTKEANWQGVDDKPIAGSNNLTDSNGVFVECGKILSTEKQDIGGKYLNLYVKRQHNYLLGNGNIIDNTNYSLLIDVSGLRGLHLTRLVGFYNNYAFLTEYDLQNLKATFCAGTSRVVGDLSHIKVPFDANYLYWYMSNSTDNPYPAITIDEYNSVGLQNDVKRTQKAGSILSPLEIKELQYVSNTGSLVGAMYESSNSVYNTLFDIYVFQVKAGNKYYINADYSGLVGVSSLPWCINWFDNSNQFISFERIKKEKFENLEVIAPENASYLYLSVMRSNAGKCSVIDYSQTIYSSKDESAIIQNGIVGGSISFLGIEEKNINSNGEWVSGLHSFLIDVSNAKGCIITNVSGGKTTQYAFIKDYDNYRVNFCSGCKRESGIVNGATIPDDANYLYQVINNTDWSDNYTYPQYNLHYIGISDSCLPNLMMEKTAELIKLYRKLYKNTYLMIPLRHKSAVYQEGAYPSYYDNWGAKIPEIVQFDSSTNTMRSILTLFRSGEAEMAIRLPRGDGNTGNVYVGGQTHGFENIITSDGNRHLTILVDGQNIGEDSVISLKPITSLYMVQESSVCKAYTNGNPWATAIKKWKFDKEGFSISTDVNVLENTDGIQNCMLGMFCVLRHKDMDDTKPYLTNKSLKDNEPFTVFNTSDGWESLSENSSLKAIDKECTTITEWGELGIGFSMHIKNANTLDSGGMYVATNSSSYNKIYYGHGVNFNAVENDVFKAEQVWKFETNGLV